MNVFSPLRVRSRHLGLALLAGLIATGAASAFGLEDRGRIAEELRADLVLVEGDPTSDILATRRIAEVWKGGVRATRKTFEAAEAGSPPLDVQGLVSSFDGEKPEAPFGAGWDVTTDSIMGGKSTATMQVATGGAEGSAGALEVQGTIAPGESGKPENRQAVSWLASMHKRYVTPRAPAAPER